MSVELRYRLDAQRNYVHGRPVMIGFTLENLSANDVWVLKWYTPLEGINGKIFELTCDGNDMLYLGRMVKRGDPEPDDYLLLKAGSSAAAEFDLSRYYSLPECGECQLKFKGIIFDTVIGEHLVMRTADEHVHIDIPGNTVSFSIGK